MRHLLDLGISVATKWTTGDAYLGCAKDSTALHVAAWCARHETVEALIARGAPIDTEDERGATPLALAVRACVDSYWTDRRSPASVRALLDAGASVARVDRFPCGYRDVDEILQSYGR